MALCQNKTQVKVSTQDFSSIGLWRRQMGQISPECEGLPGICGLDLPKNKDWLGHRIRKCVPIKVEAVHIRKGLARLLASSYSEGPLLGSVHFGFCRDFLDFLARHLRQRADKHIIFHWFCLCGSFAYVCNLYSVARCKAALVKTRTSSIFSSVLGFVSFSGGLLDFWRWSKAVGVPDCPRQWLLQPPPAERDEEVVVRAGTLHAAHRVT